MPNDSAEVLSTDGDSVEKNSLENYSISQLRELTFDSSKHARVIHIKHEHVPHLVYSGAIG